MAEPTLPDVEVLFPRDPEEEDAEWEAPKGWERLDVSKGTKRRLLGPEYPGSQQLPATTDEMASQFGGAKALEPPYDPVFLIYLYRQSSCLRQCVDAYVANIESPGARFEAFIDLDNPRADDEEIDRQVADHLLAEASWPANENVSDPTPAETKAEKERLRPLQRLERIRLERWLQSASPQGCLTSLRESTRRELEITGNAYWEVSWPEVGWPELILIPTQSVRMLPEDEHPVLVSEQIKVSSVAYGERRVWRKFHRYVQIVGNRRCYFKEFDDPRVYSRKTGDLVAQDGSTKIEWPKGDGPATEIVHWKADAPNSSYGIARWVGNWLNVIGLRESEEVNRNIFEHKSLPVAIYLASGGTFPKEVVKRLQDANKEMIQGINNYHRSLFIHAVPSSANADTAHMKLDVKFVPQPTDATFREYGRDVFDKVAMSFRLARLLVGNMKDFNRATAEAALQFCEAQVFQPLRQAFDDWINRHLFSRFGVRFWRLVSNGPIPKDSAAVAELAIKATDTGAITLNELRQVLADVFNRPYAKLEQAWADIPLKVMQAAPELATGVPAEPEPQPAPAAGQPVEPEPPAEKPPAPPPPEDAAAAAEKAALALVAIRDALVKAEASQAAPAGCQGHDERQG
jgi:capsid portal protein